MITQQHTHSTMPLTHANLEISNTCLHLYIFPFSLACQCTCTPFTRLSFLLLGFLAHRCFCIGDLNFTFVNKLLLHTHKQKSLLFVQFSYFYYLSLTRPPTMASPFCRRPLHSCLSNFFLLLTWSSNLSKQLWVSPYLCTYTIIVYFCVLLTLFCLSIKNDIFSIYFLIWLFFSNPSLFFEIYFDQDNLDARFQTSFFSRAFHLTIYTQSDSVDLGGVSCQFILQLKTFGVLYQIKLSWSWFHLLTDLISPLHNGYVVHNMYLLILSQVPMNQCSSPAVSTGLSCIISASLSLSLMAGMQFFRNILVVSKLSVMLTGFLGSINFLLILTAISSFEMASFGKHFQSKVLEGMWQNCNWFLVDIFLQCVSACCLLCLPLDLFTELRLPHGAYNSFHQCLSCFNFVLQIASSFRS